MIYPEKMKKIRIYALKSHVDLVVDFLQKEEVLHLSTSSLKNKEAFKSSLTFPWYKEFSDLAHVVRTLAKLFNIKRKEKDIEVFEISYLLSKKEKVEELYKRITTLIKEKENIEEELKEAIEKIKEISYFIALYPGKAPEQACVIGITGEEKEVKRAINELKKRGLLISYKKKHLKDRVYAVLLTSIQGRSLASSFKINVVKYPKDKTISSLYKELQQKIRELKEKKRAIEEKIEEIKKRYKTFIEKLYLNVEVYSIRAKAAEKFKESKSIVVIEGWVPEKKEKELKRKLYFIFREKVFVEQGEAKKELPPTLLNNPKEMKAIEDLVEMIALPKANEYDPTAIYFFTIPLLYGMILGDVIYSLIAMAFSLWLGKTFKSKLAQLASKLWFLSSIAGIAWGLVFDEWLGVSHAFWINKIGAFFGFQGIEIYHGFSRMHFLPILMIVAILLGVAQLIFGFILAFLHEIKHNKKHALAKLGFALFLFFTSLTFLTLGGVLELPENALYIGIAFSIALVYYGEGAIGVMELTTAIGNSISYVRLAAVGIVGVVVAELINQAFAPSPERGLLNLLLFALLISLHFVNAVVAMFEGIIQGGRLNVVEFATKFYKGGGIKYQPFSYKLK